MHLKVPPVPLMVVVAGLMAAVAKLTPGLRFALPGSTPLAVLFFAAGSVTCALGVVAFRQARTTVDPTRPGRASTLVVAGVYRWTRNPMYLGLLGLLIGWALHLSNLAAALLGPPIFVAWLNRFQIVPEEAALDETFGASYSEYRRRVRRWL